MSDRPRPRTRLEQYRHDRFIFAVKVYSLTALFLLLSLLQWVAMLMVDDLRDIMVKHFYISMVCLFFALFVITLFIFFENLRFLVPVNWLLTIIIVECVTWGLGRIVVAADTKVFSICFFVVALFTVIFLSIGILMRHDLTLDVVILFLMSTVFFIGSIFFVLLHILSGAPLSLHIYTIFVMITVLMFLMYHAQTINGGRYAQMRLSDYLLATLIIYHDFVILFVLLFYSCSKLMAFADDKIYMWGNCDDCLEWQREKLIEFITWGMGRIVVAADGMTFAMCFSTVCLLSVIFVSTGIHLKRDLTVEIVTMFMMSTVFFLGSVIFALLHILAGVPLSVHIYGVFIMIIVVPFMMFHAQVVNGSRYAQFRLNDRLLAALVIYLDCIILVVATFYSWAQLLYARTHMWGNCDDCFAWEREQVVVVETTTVKVATTTIKKS